MGNPRFRRRGVRRGTVRPDGYRSAFEAKVAKDLTDRGVQFDYESVEYKLQVPGTPGHQCMECGEKRIVRLTKYTPDFQIAGGKLIVETKGRFTGKDRKVALAFIAQYPRNYKLLFMRDNTLSKASDTKYSDWCNKNGIECAVGASVPAEWLEVI